MNISLFREPEHKAPDAERKRGGAPSRRRMAMVAALVLVAPCGTAQANQVRERVEVRIAPDKAWALIGDFCGVKDWHPAIASCELKQDGKKRMRLLTTREGAAMIEQEMTRSDPARAYSYKSLETPLPVENYVSTLRVLPIDRGRIAILWVGAFKPVGPAAAAEAAVSETYRAGLLALKQKLEAGGANGPWGSIP